MTSSGGINYSEKDVDYFAFVDEHHRMWLIPIIELKDKKVVTLDKITTSSRNWSTNERFGSEKYLITKHSNK